jgi:hypothetical protein
LFADVRLVKKRPEVPAATTMLPFPDTMCWLEPTTVNAFEPVLITDHWKDKFKESVHVTAVTAFSPTIWASMLVPVGKVADTAAAVVLVTKP